MLKSPCLSKDKLWTKPVVSLHSFWREREMDTSRIVFNSGEIDTENAWDKWEGLAFEGTCPLHWLDGYLSLDASSLGS